MLISRISRRISSGTVGRSPRGGDFQRQYDPARCQRTMVSGFTIANASRTLRNNRNRPTNTNRSITLKESFFGAVRRSVDLLPQRPNLCLKRCSRADQIDDDPTKKPTNIPVIVGNSIRLASGVELADALG